jgi:thiol-disulfide isomerase/thioredoxin
MTEPVASDQTRKRPFRYAWRLSALAAVALFLALLVYGLLSKPADTTIDSRLAEAKAPRAPGFALEVLQEGSPGPRLERRLEAASYDGELALQELRGAPVVLNFWASWCPPCREEAPRLERSWRESRDRGVVVLGLVIGAISSEQLEEGIAAAVDGRPTGVLQGGERRSTR